MQVWAIKLSNGNFAMSQKRVENLLHVTAVSVAAYVQVTEWPCLGKAHVSGELRPEQSNAAPCKHVCAPAC